MIHRHLQSKLLSLATQYPVIGLVGPRQSGKTTLAKATFSRHNYVTLEDLDVRELAKQDPRLFFSSRANDHGLIIDEIQEAPELLNYMQGIVDQVNRPGYFVITGSQNILVHEKISQTLAGRIALFTLLPLSTDELADAQQLPSTLEEILFKGCYPRIYAHKIDPTEWFKNYIATYVERDVRQIINITSTLTFQNFLKLCAGRVGQLLDYTSLAHDCGISPNTAKAWISLLQTSYIIFLVHPYFKNFSKRVIKAPKLYFYDTGLCCKLLSITAPKELFTHYLRGGLFESFVISDFIKQYENAYQNPDVYFWRDVQGNEVDCLLTHGETVVPVEIKSGLTINSSFFDGIKYWQDVSSHASKKAFVVYGGREAIKWPVADVVGWHETKKIVDFVLKK